MRISIDHLIIRGSVDNTTRGSIVLRLEFVGRKIPVEWTFQGDCLRDIAGCRLIFENPFASTSLTEDDEQFLAFLKERQSYLCAGDMTASRRLCDRDNRQALNNVLSLELLDPEEGGRILIESNQMKLTTEARAWEMSEEEETALCLINQDAFRYCLHRAFDQYRQVRLPDADDFPLHEWDRRLCEAEARACAYAEVRDKYAGQAGSEVSMAYVLGCDFLLARQAYADEHAEPPPPVIRESGIMLASFMDAEDAAALQKLAQHPVYHQLEALMDFFREHAELVTTQEKADKDEPSESEVQLRLALEKQAFIVPRLLSTLMAIREGTIDRQQLADRCSRLTQNLDELALLLDMIPESWGSDGCRLVRRVKYELIAFCRETCKGL